MKHWYQTLTDNHDNLLIFVYNVYNLLIIHWYGFEKQNINNTNLHLDFPLGANEAENAVFSYGNIIGCRFHLASRALDKHGDGER